MKSQHPLKIGQVLSKVAPNPVWYVVYSTKHQAKQNIPAENKFILLKLKR
jgi:hypothetical protein